jgi:hypothetical protein
MFCESCGSKIDGRWTTCRSCGVHLQRKTESQVAVGAKDLRLTSLVATTNGHSRELSTGTIAHTGNVLTKEAGVAILPPTTTDRGYVPDADVSYLGAERTKGVEKRGVFRLRNLLIAASILLIVALLSSAAFAYSGLRSDLRTTEGDLASNKKQLAVTQGDLKSMTSERDGLKTQLSSANNELTGVKTTLTDAQNKVELQSGQIDTLKSCLNGVTSALIYIAEGYFEVAIGALNAVSVSCESADKLF